METLTKNNKTLYYEVIRNKKKQYHVKVEGNKVIIDAPDYASKKEIEQVLSQQFLHLYEKTNPEKVFKYVHYDGDMYKLKCVKGKKESIVIENGEMIITSPIDEKRAYHKVFKDFLKKAVENELVKLIYDAQYDFNEIDFPKIIVTYRTSIFGRYQKKENVITISSTLARYDFKYIKVVLYHELVHTLELSHSDRFFDIFEKKYPGGSQLDGRLKLYRFGDYF